MPYPARKFITLIACLVLLLVGLSIVVFPKKIAQAIDFFLGSDPATGDVIIKEIGGDVLLRLNELGVLTVSSINAGNIHPTSTTLWPDEATILSGVFNYSTNPNQMYGGVFEGGVNGTTLEIKFFLKGGSYKLFILGLTNKSRGKIDWFIDGNLSLAAQDWYSQNTNYNVVKSADVTISGDGIHTLKGVMNGKNPASSSFGLSLTKIWLK